MSGNVGVEDESAETPPRTGNGGSHFVHDFAGIDLPLEHVVRAIGLIATPRLVADFVAHAWNDEVRVLEAVQHAQRHVGDPRIDVAFGARRSRQDAMILPITWRSTADPWVPPLDADLEFAAFGPARTHVHLYGCSELPPGSITGSQAASLAQRLTVAIVRHVLNLMTGRILELADDRTIGNW